MTPHQHLSEQDVKHLELLQSVISRLGNNSFLVKGWCITLDSTLTAMAHGRPPWSTIPVTVTVAIGFWLLDGYYLRQERLFRGLHERVATGGEAPPPRFTMDAHRYGGEAPWLPVLLSRPMLFCYGSLVTAGSLLILFLS
ncbi:hypothetical protein ACIRBZ_13550 [Streptomyces sp. NPDC094038]|uniref:hypothetical protein n=1 Tax=Streptomyces sp. NPDC094038 TaxID=3366055 RepID=UPI00381776F7